MPAVLKRQIEGLEPFLAKLAGLRQSLQNKILRPALNKAARVVAKAVKAVTPVGATGQLKKSISSWVQVEKGVVVGIVKPRTPSNARMEKLVGKFGHRVNPAKYAHIVEGGRTAVAVVEKRALFGWGLFQGRAVARFWGKGVAAAPGRHFMRRGWDSSRDAAGALIRAAILEGIAKHMKAA